MDVRVLRAFVCRKSGYEQTCSQCINRRDVNWFSIEGCALALRSREEFVAYRVVHHTGQQRSFFRQRNRHSEARIPVRKICGAVKRINIPAILRISCVSRPFLSNDRVLRKFAAQTIDDGALRAAISLRNQVNFTRVANMWQKLKLCQENLPRFASRFRGHFEKWSIHQINSNVRSTLLKPFLLS